jgi:flagellar motor switch protein FliG
MVKSRSKDKPAADRDLDGVDKVTALLLAMGKPKADLIIKQLENSDIRALTRAALELPEVHLERIEALAKELAAEVGKSSPLVGSTEGVKELFSGVVAEETISELMDEIAGEPPKAIWSRLASVPVARLAEYIGNELPQVATYILANLPSEKATEVIQMLDIEVQADIGARLLCLKPISKEAALIIADRLTKDLLGEKTASPKANGHAKLGAILNNLDRGQMSGILERIALRSPDEIKEVKKYIFSFEDLASMSPGDRSRLLDDVPSDRIVLAVRGCDPALTELVLSSLSPRSRRIAEAEMSSGANPPQKAIIDARRSIAAQALTLANNSVIKLVAGNAED